MMTICPVAIAIGCKKCPLFAICPVKTIIGNDRPAEHVTGKSRSSKQRQHKKGP